MLTYKMKRLFYILSLFLVLASCDSIDRHEDMLASAASLAYCSLSYQAKAGDNILFIWDQLHTKKDGKGPFYYDKSEDVNIKGIKDNIVTEIRMIEEKSKELNLKRDSLNAIDSHHPAVVELNEIVRQDSLIIATLKQPSQCNSKLSFNFQLASLIQSQSGKVENFINTYLNKSASQEEKK